MIEVLDVTWFILFASGVLSQLVVPMLYRDRRPNQNGGIMSLLFLFTSMPVAYYAFEPKYWLSVLFFSVYFCINAWVLIEWRFHPLRTLRQVVRSAAWLSVMMGAIIGSMRIDALTNNAAALIALFLNGYAVVAILRVLRAASITERSSKKQPSVTVAIPARNETHALTQNLKSLVASNYGKLEILVADDCSQDDTAQIIRSYAQDGVRFIQGHSPHESWIGKNLAYDMLKAEASGDILLFCGVDTRFEPDAIAKLVNHMEAEKLDMVSVMPQHLKMNGLSLIVQPIRYLLTIFFGARSNSTALSTVWAIRTTTLEKLGGFEGVQNTILPERVFAQKLAKKHKYGLIVAPPELGITSHKKPSSQADTAVRVTYPLLRKSVGNHAIFTIGFLLGFFYPFYIVFESLLGVWTLAASIALLSIIALFIAYIYVIRASYPKQSLMLVLLTLPAGFSYYYYLSAKSMFMFETENIIWKGRNICAPVMMPR